MPTLHPRTNITHTPQVVHALEIARRGWPEETRDSALLLHLLDEGAKAVEDRMSSGDAERTTRLRDVAGRHGEHYGDDYLRRLREDWDE